MSAEAGTEDPPAIPEKKKGPLRWLLIALGLIVLLLAAAFAFLNTSIGKRFIADQIAQVAPASGLRFEVGRIEGNVFDDAVIHDLILLDPKGEFARFNRVELEWSPLAWITSGLDVDRLVAQRGTLSRFPELLPGDPDAPILPDFDIRIGKLALENLTLAPGLAGEEAQSIGLTARADIRSGRVYLKADGQLGEQDALALLVDAEPDGDLFDLDLNYSAPQGGIIAGMIGTQSGYSVRLTGDGSWSQWNGDLVAREDDRALAALELTNQAGRYAIKGLIYPGNNISGIPANALGQRVALGAAGTLEDSLLDGAIAINGRGLRLRGEGEVDLAGNRFDEFDVEGRVTDPAILGGSTTIEGAAFNARLNGAFRNLGIAHQLTIDRFAAGEASISDITQRGTATFDGTIWRLPMDARIGSVRTGADFVDPKLVGGQLTGLLKLENALLTSDNLRLAFPDARAQLGVRGDLAAGSYSLTGPVEVQNLVIENVGSMSGRSEIDFDIRDNGVWALRTEFDARVPSTTNATLANIAGGNIRASGSISLGAASPLDFRNVRLNADKLSISMNGKVAQGTTSLAGRGRHTQYGPFTVEGAFGASGPTANLVFADPLPAAGLKDVRVAIQPSEEGFAIETEGDSLLGDFAGSLGLIAPEAGPTRIDIDTLRVWKTNLSGELVLGDGGADGSLALSGGGLDGRIGLAARDGGQGFAFNIDANRASFGGDTPLSIASADLEGRGYLKDGESTVEANMQAEGLSFGTLFVGRMAAATKLRNGIGSATASLAGRRGSRFNLQLNANIAPERIALASQGEFAGKRIRMPKRAVLSKLNDGGWRLDRTLLQYGAGGAVLSGEFGGDRNVANLALDDMPLSLVDLAVADFGLGGTISGRIEYASNGSAPPTGRARVKVDSLSRSGFVLTSRPVDLSLVGNLSASALELRAVIDEGSQRRGRLQARINNLAQSGDLVPRLRSGDLFAQLRFNGPAAALWRLAAIEAFDMTGPVSVAANVTGTLANPQVRGSLASNKLRVQSALSGTDVRDITARGSFAGSRLRLTRFSGTASNGGTVSGSGIIDLSDIGPKGPELDIRIAAKNARLLNANGLNATITGPLRIISNGVGGTIAGRVEVDRASWKLGTADAAAELPNIKTTEINIPADIAPVVSRRAPWRYLIDARARSRVDVDGMGLDSEWRADIQLRGTTSDPRLGGNARVIRGSYSFAGTRFELTRGRINFDVNQPIDPRLDIIAETNRQGVDVRVSVQGNALQPEITFSSTPLLPEEEILARLLFGGSISDLSATDALQLGTALASLRGGAGLDPINQLRSAIGLDRLRIVSADPALNRGTGVALGKNIGRRFYVELVTDGRGYSATEAEFRITSWLSLLGSVSTIGRESVVAEISRDY